jgi:phosphatidylglycerophosphate synthase
VLDHLARKAIDPPLALLGRRLADIGLTANAISVCGFLVGMSAAPLIAFGATEPALIAIIFNRIADGLDGAVARASTPTETGAFLDIVLDFIFYSAVIFAFALYSEANALAAAFLIFAFIGTGTTFLAFAIFAARYDLVTNHRGRKSIYYLGGLTEGTETVTCLILLCLFPAQFPIIAFGFGLLCWITTGTRIIDGYHQLRRIDAANLRSPQGADRQG